ncbi:transcription repressor NadR [Wukongibacter baidiensis]|uniref:transcription repressor NadR n=1 Tax=Wukongibacter baidiensis TaxID=1723361 RepID=UPI003D7FD7F6
MITDERRRKLLDILNSKDEPITGTDLSKRFNISRQVIVQDIAVLRAQGMNIMATSNGYYIPQINEDKRNIKTVICNHSGYESIEDELRIMIDMGAKVLDVIVDHPVYGEIRCPLMINSRYDLEKFIKKVKDVKAEPLASLTDGEHIHTIEVPCDEVYYIIKEKLDEAGILVKD